MYTQFFHLKQAPFSIAPDPRYLFMSERHREALAHLLYGIGSGGGFVLLTGEIGAGKTTVCRCFIEQIPANCKLAYIFNPKLSVEELLQSICEEFGIAVAERTPPATVKAYVDAINAYLLESHGTGRNNVLVIDEAQNLSADVLEQLRLLTNLETNERKLLQIVLIGQPELRAMLARPELEQLAQRVIARYHLGSLTEGETGSYIAHRLAVAGAASAPLFPARLMGTIHKLSKGVPRRINLLCDRALLGTYVENRAQVTGLILRRAAAEVFAEGAAGSAPMWAAWPSWSMGAGGLVAGVALCALAASIWLPRRPALQPPPPVASQALPRQPAASMAAVAGTTLPGADSEAALRQLAALWGEVLPAGEACQAAAKLDLRCHQSRGGLDELRVLDRPAVLSLHEGPAGAPATVSYAVLLGLNETGVTLRIDGKPQLLAYGALAQRFDGQFTTFWRAKRGWRDQVSAGERGADVDWLAQHLAQRNRLPIPAVNQPLDAATLGLLRQFQLDQKLGADGVAGPMTFIRLNQLAGGKEPRLIMSHGHAVAGK